MKRNINKDYRVILDGMENKSKPLFMYNETKAYNTVLSIHNLNSYLRSGAWYNSISETANVLGLLQETSNIIKNHPVAENKVVTEVTRFLTENAVVTNWHDLNESKNSSYTLHEDFNNLLDHMDKLDADVYGYTVANKECNFDTKVAAIVRSTNHEQTAQLIIGLVESIIKLEVPTESVSVYINRFLDVLQSKNTFNSKDIDILRDCIRLYLYLNNINVSDITKDPITPQSLFIFEGKSIIDWNSNSKYNDIIICMVGILYPKYKHVASFKKCFEIISNNMSIKPCQCVYNVMTNHVIPSIECPEIDGYVNTILNKTKSSSKTDKEIRIESIDRLTKLISNVVGSADKIDDKILGKIFKDLDMSNADIAEAYNCISLIGDPKFISKVEEAYAYNPSNDADVHAKQTAMLLLLADIGSHNQHRRLTFSVVRQLVLYATNTFKYTNKKIQIGGPVNLTWIMFICINSLQTIGEYESNTDNFKNTVDNLYRDIYNTFSDTDKEIVSVRSSVINSNPVMHMVVNYMSTQVDKFADSMIRISKSYDDPTVASELLLTNIRIYNANKDYTDMDTILKDISATNTIIASLISRDEVKNFKTAILVLIKSIDTRLEPVKAMIAGHDMEEIIEDLMKFRLSISDPDIYQAINGSINMLRDIYKEKYGKDITLHRTMNNIIYLNVIYTLTEIDIQTTWNSVPKHLQYVKKYIDPVIINNSIDLFTEWATEAYDLKTILNTNFNTNIISKIDLISIFSAILSNVNIYERLSSFKVDVMRSELINTWIDEAETVPVYTGVELDRLLISYRLLTMISRSIPATIVKRIDRLLSDNKGIIICEDVDDPYDDNYFKFDMNKKKKNNDKDNEDEEDDEDDDDIDDDNIDDDFDDDDVDDDDWDTYNEDPKKAKANEEAIFGDKALLTALVYEHTLSTQLKYMDKGAIPYLSIPRTKQLAYGINYNISENVRPESELPKMMRAIVENYDNILICEANEDIKKSKNKKNKAMSVAKSKASTMANNTKKVSKSTTDNIKKSTDSVKSKVKKTAGSVKKTAGEVGDKVAPIAYKAMDKTADILQFTRGEAAQISSDISIIRNQVKSAATKVSGLDAKYSKKIDTAFDKTMRDLKKDSVNKNRQAIINGNLYPSLSTMIKLVGTSTAATALGQPIIGLVILLGGIGTSVKANKEERINIANELNVQSKVIDKKIQDAEANNDHDTYEVLLKIQNRINKEVAQLTYKTKNARAAATLDKISKNSND